MQKEDAQWQTRVADIIVTQLQKGRLYEMLCAK